jgi:hypothetical protein
LQANTRPQNPNTHYIEKETFPQELRKQWHAEVGEMWPALQYKVEHPEDSAEEQQRWEDIRRRWREHHEEDVPDYQLTSDQQGSVGY